MEEVSSWDFKSVGCVLDLLGQNTKSIPRR